MQYISSLDITVRKITLLIINKGRVKKNTPPPSMEK